MAATRTTILDALSLSVWALSLGLMSDPARIALLMEKLLDLPSPSIHIVGQLGTQGSARNKGRSFLKLGVPTPFREDTMR